MPSWNDLQDQFASQPDDAARQVWLRTELTKALATIGEIRQRNVLLYGSAFLQKPQVPAQFAIITNEDLNGFMSTIYKMGWDKGLSLLLHTPGGDPNAAGAIVEYLRSKFQHLEVIVPAFAMSAGTMISLSADKIVMGRQSQLGPIDPQMNTGGRSISLGAVVDQFKQAKTEVSADRVNAHVWAPILQSLGPSLLQEAKNALDYSESMVSDWLAAYMLRDQPDLAKAVARHFNDTSRHKSHGRRIDRDEARSNNVKVEDLESDQSLQEVVLTAYHLMTILFESSMATKVLWSDHGRTWLKNWGGQVTPPTA